jgi:hypothetical protein
MRYKIMYWGCSSKFAFGISEASDMCFVNCILIGSWISQVAIIVRFIRCSCIFINDIYEVTGGAMDLFNCNYDLYLCIYVCYMLASCLDAAYISTYIIFVFRCFFLAFSNTLTLTLPADRERLID